MKNCFPLATFASWPTSSERRAQEQLQSRGRHTLLGGHSAALGPPSKLDERRTERRIASRLASGRQTVVGGEASSLRARGNKQQATSNQPPQSEPLSGSLIIETGQFGFNFLRVGHLLRQSVSPLECLLRHNERQSQTGQLASPKWSSRGALWLTFELHLSLWQLARFFFLKFG